MKTKRGILAISSASLLLTLFGLYHAKNSRGIPFTLVEARSGSPMANKYIGICYHQMVHDAPPIFERIKTVKTDDEGNFTLQRRMIAKRELAIKCGDGLRPVIFAIRDNEIWLLRLRNGFSQTIAKTRYDLSSGRETTFNLYKNTVEKEFTRVKLIAYDKESYFTKLKDIIESNQQQFEANQSGLWDFLWDRLRLAPG